MDIKDILNEITPWDIISDISRGVSRISDDKSHLSDKVQGVAEVLGGLARSGPYLVTGGHGLMALTSSLPTATTPILVDKIGVGLGQGMIRAGHGLNNLFLKQAPKAVISGVKSIPGVSKLASTAKFAGTAGLIYSALAVGNKLADLTEDVIQYRRGNKAAFNEEMQAYKNPGKYITDILTFQDGPQVTIKGLGKDKVLYKHDGFISRDEYKANIGGN